MMGIYCVIWEKAPMSVLRDDYLTEDHLRYFLKNTLGSHSN